MCRVKGLIGLQFKIFAATDIGFARRRRRLKISATQDVSLVGCDSIHVHRLENISWSGDIGQTYVRTKRTVE